MIFILLPILIFAAVSVLVIISIAWTHRPISVWQMVKEELQKTAERKINENHNLRTSPKASDKLADQIGMPL